MDAPQLLRATRPLAGRVRVPGDKSIGHRSLLIGALCDGAVAVSGLSDGEDNRSSASILGQLGVRIERHGEGRATVHGVGLEGLKEPAEPLTR